MLDTMRALSKSIVSKLLMGVLVLAFGVWGIGDMAREHAPSYAAKVGGGTISMGEFRNQRAVMKSELQAMGMTNLPESKLTFAVIRQLVQQHLVQRAVEDLGLYVNEELLISHLRTMPEFKDKDGKFSATRFQAIVKNQGIPERIFLDGLKQEMAGKFMLDSLDMSDAPLPTSILSLRAISEGETRDAVLITIPARDAMDEHNMEALKKYYEENKDTRYMTPETRTLKYVVVSDADMDTITDASITKEDLAAAMKANPSLNEGLARLKLRAEHRDTALQNLSNTIEDALAAGKSMAEAFASAGIKSSTQELASVTANEARIEKDEVKKTAIEQAFSLAQGEVSRLISTPKGTRLMVSVTRVVPPSPKPFEQVTAQVKEDLGQQLAKDAAKAKAAGVKEALAKAPDWKAVASEQKLATRVVSAVERASVLEKPDSSIPPALRQALFEHKAGEVAGPLTLPNGDQMLAVVLEIHVPTADSARLKQSKASASAGEEINRNIQGRAYEYFVSRFPVKVNPAIANQGDGGE